MQVDPTLIIPQSSWQLGNKINLGSDGHLTLYESSIIPSVGYGRP
jgi:hypothetical protein